MNNIERRKSKFNRKINASIYQSATTKKGRPAGNIILQNPKGVPMKAKYMLALTMGFLLFSNYSRAGDHTINTPIELTETAINRFLQNQYQEGGLPAIVNGNIGGITYTLNLSLPSIILLQNEAKVRFVIDITSTIGSYHVDIEPGLGIDPGNISTSQVTAFLTNLPALVQLLPLDQRLKDAIVQAYNSLNLVMYPAKLLSQITTPWLDQRRVNVTNLSLGWQVAPGILRLIPGATLNSNVPLLWVGLWGFQGDDYLVVLSNIKVTVSQGIIVPLSGTPTIWQGSPNQICPKGESIWINLGDVGIGSGDAPVARIIYKTSDTFYVREYGQVAVNTGNLYGHTKAIN